MSNSNTASTSSNVPAGDHPRTQQLLQVLHQQDGKKTNQLSAKPMANRPIAPAPGPVGQHAGPVGTASPHNIVAKVPAALVSGTVEGTHGKMLTHAAVSAPTTTSHQTLSALPTAVGLVPTTANIVQPTALPISHQVKVPMASLIRSGPMAHTASQQFATGQAHTVVTGAATIPQVHTFQSHVPRGAVQASQLAVSKSTPLATPVVRATVPSTMQITTMTSTNPGVQTIQQQLHNQPKALQLPIQTAGPTTTPLSRTTSPQVSLTSSEHRMPTTYHRQQAVTTTPTVQITIQQPRTPTQLLSQHQPSSQQPQAAKPVQSPQITPKQMMSQATVPPMIHSTSSTPITTAKIGTAHGQPFLSQVIQRPQGKVIVTQSSTTPIIQSPNLVTATTTPKAFGITVTGGLSKGSKIVVTQAASLPTIQSTLPVTLAPHPGLEQSLRVNLTAAAPLSRQKMTVGPQLATVSTTLHPGVQPKPGAPTVTLTASTHTMSAVQGAVAMASAVNPTITTTVPSIPVAKVQPTRQLPPASQVVSQTSSQVASHVGLQTPTTTQSVHDASRDGQSTTLQNASLPTTLHQGSIFLSQPHRGSPNTPTTTIATTHTEGRITDRANLPAHLPYAALPEYYTTVVNYPNYPNLLYQNMPNHPQNFSSLPSAATSIRPGIVPTQTSNLAATFQAATHGAAVSTTQGVRLNPMMVTVDPSRHPSLMHTQFAATSESRSSSLSENTSVSAASVAVVSSTNSTLAAQASQQPLASNPSASPRPSILRKRTNDGNVALVKKNLMAMGLDTSSPSTDGPHQPAPAISPKSSICDPSRENSQSSTDTATSSESPPTSVQTPELRKEFKQEPMDVTENGITPLCTSSGSSLPNSMEASPRKKPRKQLLNANEELKDGSSSDEEADKLPNISLDIKTEIEKVEAIKKEEYVDDEGIRWVAERKRPNVSLLNHYQITWKARNNHYLKHSDVKPKEERRPTVNELANQKAVMQKASGWKLYHLAAQLEEMMDLEKDMFKKMAEVQEAIAPKHIAKHTMEDDIGMVHELTQGNIQRSQLVMDQLEEAKTSMTKVLDHKTRILEIIIKHHSKRPVKKKERT